MNISNQKDFKIEDSADMPIKDFKRELRIKLKREDPGYFILRGWMT